MNPYTYRDELIRRHPALSACADDISEAFELMKSCYEQDGKMLICGNGGSAADAEHWAGELMKAFGTIRPIPQSARNKLPSELADRLQGALATVPLSGFIALASAYANDVDSKYIYAQMVWGLGRPGDILVGITTSGNSENILLALQASRARDMKTVALTGKSGGKAASLVDVTIRVPADATHEVQEYHLPVYHCLSQMLECVFFG